MALRANDDDGYKSWLALGVEDLGRDIAGEVESYWIVPLLVEQERDRLMASQLGVSLYSVWGIAQQRKTLGWRIRIRSVSEIVKWYRRETSMDIHAVKFEASIVGNKS